MDTWRIKMLYNVYRRVEGHRGKFRKIYSTDDWEDMNKHIDMELFQHGTKPEDILVRRAGFEPDKIQGDLYGCD